MVVLIDSALRAISCDGEAPVAVASILGGFGHPSQRRHGGQRVASGILDIRNKLHGIALRSVSAGIEVFEVVVRVCVVRVQLPVVG